MNLRYLYIIPVFAIVAYVASCSSDKVAGGATEEADGITAAGDSTDKPATPVETIESSSSNVAEVTLSSATNIVVNSSPSAALSSADAGTTGGDVGYTGHGVVSDPIVVVDPVVVPTSSYVPSGWGGAISSESAFGATSSESSAGSDYTAWWPDSVPKVDYDSVKDMKWNGPDAYYTVIWNSEAEKEMNSGFFYGFTDSANGGTSQLEWPVLLGNVYDNNSLDPVIDFCGGVCGVYDLRAAPAGKTPYVGVGFGLIGKYEQDSLSLDISGMKSFCMVYMSDIGIEMRIVPEKNLKSVLGNDAPYVTFPKVDKPQKLCFDAAQFKFHNQGQVSVTDVLQKASHVEFIMPGASGNRGFFGLYGMNWD